MTAYNVEQFTVDSEGAFVTSLTDSNGKPVLYNQTTIGEKRRGGAHVCLPYFGPDAAGVLPQHGFGRGVEWNVTVSQDGREVRCEYTEKNSERFLGLYATLLYQLSEAGDTFTTALTVENRGKNAFDLSPGFHPYFAVDPNDVALNDEAISLVDFEPFKEYPNSPSMALQTAGRTVTVSSQDMQHMVAWSDSRGEYLCIEPTVSGGGYSSVEHGTDVLQVGEKAAYAYMISWS